jgi:hypothetical protein
MAEELLQGLQPAGRGTYAGNRENEALPSGGIGLSWNACRLFIAVRRFKFLFNIIFIIPYVWDRTISMLSQKVIIHYYSLYPRTLE